MADLPSKNADPPKFHGSLQPHTGREADNSDSNVGPGEYDINQHTVGPQTLSHRPSLPAYSFGFGGPSLAAKKYPDVHRDTAKFPGPGAYPKAIVPSVGRQAQSTRSNTFRFSFGTGIRDPQSPLRSMADTVPGAANTIKPMIKMGAAPGDYGRGPESIGAQYLSPRKTLPSYTFGSDGTRTKKRNRFKMDRVVHYGRDSPGPAEYKGVIPSVGRQVLSSKKKARTCAFGKAGKFRGGNFKKPTKDRRAMTPGPGKYVLLSAIGVQKESNRPTTATTRFGTAAKDTHYNVDPHMPGPGAYSDFIGKEELFGPKSPRFGFGTTRKFRDKAVIML